MVPVAQALMSDFGLADKWAQQEITGRTRYEQAINSRAGLHGRLFTPSYCRMLRKQCHALRYVSVGEACNLH